MVSVPWSNEQWEPHVWKATETPWTCLAYVRTRLYMRFWVSWIRARIHEKLLLVVAFVLKNIVGKSVCSSCLKPHVENLWPASMVVSASMSSAVSGCRGDVRLSAVGCATCVCVCVVAGVERTPWRQIGFLCPEMPATYTCWRSNTETLEMWACRHYTPSHRRPQTLKHTHTGIGNAQTEWTHT